MLKIYALENGGAHMRTNVRRCPAQVHLFHVTENDTRLTWMSKDNRNRSISIQDVKDVRHPPLHLLHCPP